MMPLYLHINKKSAAAAAADVDDDDDDDDKRLMADDFQNHCFSKNSLRNTIRVSNSLDLAQIGHFVKPDLGSNFLQ